MRGVRRRSTRRVPLISTLHRYLSRDLVKTAVLAALAFTVVMTVFAIIEPMRKQGLAPAQVMRLFGYLLPVTLSLTLPIAALFSATIVYGRFSMDNELTACRASGVSTLSLLKPALVMAAIVSIVSLTLSNFVAPQLARLGEEATRANLKGIVYQGLRTRTHFKWDRLIIHADRSDPVTDTLEGVVIIQPDKPGEAFFVVASGALIAFDQDGDDTFVKFTPIQPTVGRQNDFSMAEQERQTFGPYRIERFIKESPAFYDWPTLVKLKADPLASEEVQRRLKRIHQQLHRVRLYQQIAETLNAGGAYSQLTYRGVGVQERYALRAPHAYVDKAGRLVMDGGPDAPADERPVVVGVHSIADDSVKVRFHCREARLQFREGVTAQDASIEIVLTDVLQVWRPDEPDPQRTLRGEHRLGPAEIPESVLREAGGVTLQDLYQRGARQFPEIETDIVSLQDYITRNLNLKITAEMHGRVAYGAGCFLLVALGAGLGLMFRGGQIISAFALSCAPAMVLIVLMVMGRQMVSNPRSPTGLGLAAIWSGVGVLTAVLAGVYGRLSRW